MNEDVDKTDKKVTLELFESVLSNEPKAFMLPGATVYQVTSEEVLDFVRLARSRPTSTPFKVYFRLNNDFEFILLVPSVRGPRCWVPNVPQSLLYACCQCYNTEYGVWMKNRRQTDIPPDIPEDVRTVTMDDLVELGYMTKVDEEEGLRYFVSGTNVNKIQKEYWLSRVKKFLEQRNIKQASLSNSSFTPTQENMYTVSAQTILDFANQLLKEHQDHG